MKPFRAMAPQPGALPLPDHNSVLVLAANTVETVAVPATATVARLIATSFAVVLADANPPNVADLADGTAGYAIGPGDAVWLEIEPGTITNLRFNAAGTPTIGVSFWGRAG